MVAVVIFSIGLIGLASLMVVATRSNQSAYLRTQAGFLASNLADRMRANPAGVWDGDYDSTKYPVSAGSTDCSAGCTPKQVAVRDQVNWSRMLSVFLPGGKAEVACDASGLGYTPDATQKLERPPYGGSCTMKLSWLERGVGSEDRDASLKTFDWVFQP